jgi:adenylate cyclase
VAARLEALADADGICVSSRVQEDVQSSLGRLGIAFEDIGRHQLKNIQHAVHIYRVLLDNAGTMPSVPLPAPLAVPSPGSKHSAGSVQEITVLIADMEGFWGLPERLGVNTVRVMAEYFDLMSRQVHAHGGMIEKFAGDMVVAFWNGPKHALNACCAAVACQEALGRFTLRDISTLGARIGVNSGSAVVGNVGSSTQPSFAIMGDTVNIAVVLERVNKRYGTKIIVGAETRRMADDQIHVRELDGLMIQGYSAELRIYELLGLAGDERARPNWLSLYEAGLDAYRAGDFNAAIDSFRTLLSIKQSDKPSQVMLERCRLLLKAQPKDD